MKTTFLQLVTSTLSRLDPIYPRTTSHYDYEVPDEAASHAPVHVPVPVDRNEAAQYAFFLAVLSGLSLPIGAMLGVKLQPADTTIARWIAIGAGALIFAVAVELYGHSIHSFSAGHTELGPMMVLLAMSLFGSYLFTYIARMYEEEGEEDSDEEEDEEKTPRSPDASFAATTEPLRPVPPRSPVGGTAEGRACLPRQSTSDNAVHFHAHHLQAHKIGRGIGSLVRQVQHNRRWKAQKRWQHLREAMKKLHIITWLQKNAAAKKSRSEEVVGRTGARQTTTSFRDRTGVFWENMKQAWRDTTDTGEEEKLTEIEKKSRAAAMTMLIMLIVDGIPEGILLGFMAARRDLGPAFVVSLVIANFPEGFAGGQLMNMAQIPLLQIILAWAGPMLLTASGAAIACYMLLWLGTDNSYGIQVLVAAIEGVAGGAMISGIAATMLPEAFERRDKKGGILGSGGFMCTAGFLLSFGIKIALDS